MNTPPANQRKGSITDTIKAVLWGFLGVRRQADYQRDITRLNPIHLMVVGVVMALAFVGILILIVNWVAG
ncbi:DUF2970 domain-containing protein [Hydrogenophaga flava]|uniref:DUF2970 domain-containing protein n=1 Tax=Hydrogenophaga flava TaxID=65657 RepID=UPI000824CB4E|nr:DUF2970 domain-containing protein [Hydrogenophaga flava]